LSGFVFNNLIFTRTEKAVIIRRNDRPELPHLAIFFRTASGEIDGHLKDELAVPGTNAYTPLFRFPASELSNFETEVAPKLEREFRNLFSNLKKATPAWLRRHGYVLALFKTDALTSGVLDFAPKFRGKYRVDLERMKRLFSEDPSHVTLVDPSALHSDELKNLSEPIFAARSFGKDRMLGLVYGPSRYGQPVWLISNPLTMAMPNILAQTVPPEIRHKTKGIWYKVHDALQLAQLGIARD